MRMFALAFSALVLGAGFAAATVEPCDAAAGMGPAVASAAVKTESDVSQVHCRRRWHCHWWGCHRCGM